LSADQPVLLQRPINSRVFLEILKGIRGPAKCIRHNFKNKRVSTLAKKQMVEDAWNYVAANRGRVLMIKSRGSLERAELAPHP